MVKKISLFVLLLFNMLACQPKAPSGEVFNAQNVPLSLCGAVASAIDIENLPPPTMQEGMGNSHLTVTTQSVSAQQWFDYGINLLHGFWHIEAYRAFSEVIKADSTCAMAYWGIAMCQPGFGGTNNTVWTKAINKAKILKNNASKIENAFIEASDVLVSQGMEAAQTPFRNLYKGFPNEPEAIAFASIILRQHQNAQTQEEVKTVLEDAIRRFPNNIGLLHYYIHLMELRPDFAKSVSVANKLIQLAPNSPHVKHMPGHLSFLAGDYKKTVEIFKGVQKMEEAYQNREKIPSGSNQNYMHNLHYLAIAQSELGNREGALDAAQQYANITPLNTPNTEGATLMLLYEGRILPALVNIRFRNWQAAQTQIRYWLDNKAIPVSHPLVQTYLKVMNFYCLGMEALDKNDFPAAMDYGKQLSQLMHDFEQQGAQRQNSSEFKALNETFDIMSMMRYELAGWIDNMDKSKPFNASAWQEALGLEKAIQYDEPPRLMYPIGESLGRLHLWRGEKKEAQKAFIQALTRRPNSPIIKQLMAG